MFHCCLILAPRTQILGCELRRGGGSSHRSEGIKKSLKASNARLPGNSPGSDIDHPDWHILTEARTAPGPSLVPRKNCAISGLRSALRVRGQKGVACAIARPVQWVASCSGVWHRSTSPHAPPSRPRSAAFRACASCRATDPPPPLPRSVVASARPSAADAKQPRHALRRIGRRRRKHHPRALHMLWRLVAIQDDRIRPNPIRRAHDYENCLRHPNRIARFRPIVNQTDASVH